MGKPQIVVKNNTNGGILLKTVKISEEAYRAAKRLSSELEKQREGVSRVGLSDAINFAVLRTAAGIERKRKDSGKGLLLFFHR